MLRSTIFFFLVPLLAFAFEPIELELKQHVAHKNEYIARQTQKMAKLGLDTKEIKKRYVPFEEVKKQNIPMFFDLSYPNDYLTTKIDVGFPPQELNVLFSSGATFALVFDSECANKDPKQRGYNPNTSTSAKNLGKTEFATYDGPFYFNSDLYSDQLQVGYMKVQDQTINVANYISKKGFPVSGILGLSHYYSGWTKIDNSTIAPIDNLLKPSIKKVVTYYFDKHVAPNHSNESSGVVKIGGYDLNNCQQKGGSEFYVPFTYSASSPYYYIAFKSLSYGSTVILNDPNAYLDTSFSTLVLDLASVKSLYDQIRPDYDYKTGLYTVNCNLISKLQAINIGFTSNTASISPIHYVVDLNLEDNQCALAVEFNSDASSKYAQYVFGMPFFRAYCLTFDIEKNGVYVIPHLDA